MANPSRWWGRPTTAGHVIADAAAGALLLFAAWYGFGGGDVDGIVGATAAFVVGSAFGMGKIRKSRRA